MFSIAVCDDEILICSQIEKYLETYIETKDVQVEVYYSAEKLYKDLYDGVYYDLIFLDIEFPKENGVDIGNRIRNDLNNEKTHIVYISGKEKYAMRLFDVRPLHFLIKPFTREQIVNLLEKAMRLSDIYYDYFEFKVEQSFVKCLYSDIVYFESQARKIIMHTVNEDYELYGKLNSLEKEIHKSFLRVHQSYLVNPLYIKKYESNQIILIDGETLPVSQARRKEVRQKLLQNWRG